MTCTELHGAMELLLSVESGSEPRLLAAARRHLLRVPHAHLDTVADAAANDLQTRLAARGLTLSEAFSRLDADQNGSVSRRELRFGLGELGVELDAEQLKNLMLSFDEASLPATPRACAVACAVQPPQLPPPPAQLTRARPGARTGRRRRH